MTTEKELLDLKATVAKLQQDKMRAELEVETATTARNAALSSLKEEFKVSSKEEAETLLARLNAELDKKVSEARELLSKST